MLKWASCFPKYAMCKGIIGQSEVCGFCVRGESETIIHKGKEQSAGLRHGKRRRTHEFNWYGP